MDKTPSFGLLQQMDSSKQQTNFNDLTQSLKLPNIFEESTRFITRIGFGYVAPPICLFILDRLLLETDDKFRT